MRIIEFRETILIGKRRHGLMKRNSMFFPVRLFFLLIPFENSFHFLPSAPAVSAAVYRSYRPNRNSTRSSSLRNGSFR